MSRHTSCFSSLVPLIFLVLLELSSRGEEADEGKLEIFFPITHICLNIRLVLRNILGSISEEFFDSIVTEELLDLIFGKST